ncbi:recQ-mediated genome instability protein 2 isoform X1 [Pezoporus flaviventris]|uniref:recQ-mediated genome instability protein 2 isoform X1 n=1 Tax=Pezoporus flaviventris TaxID=889875 RepID=UPI002AB1BB48|nr:recQ-mediated genome instability protein 2 isoform X1 [Pezoporus flaviventris]
MQLLPLSESGRLAGSGCVSNTCLGRAKLAQLRRHYFTYTSLPTRGTLKKLCCYGSQKEERVLPQGSVFLAVSTKTRPSPASSSEDRACFQFFTVKANGGSNWDVAEKSWKYVMVMGVVRSCSPEPVLRAIKMTDLSENPVHKDMWSLEVEELHRVIP